MVTVYLIHNTFINSGDNEHPNKQVVEIQYPKFNNTGALGSLPTILFWNDPQLQLIMRIHRKEHTILMGDYGTGQLYILWKSWTCIKHILIYATYIRQDRDT